MSPKTKSLISKIFIAIVPLITVWVIDWWSKNWAISFSAPLNWGPLRFVLIYNHGIMLGFSSELPLLTKTIILTTLGSMILGSYALIVSLAPIRSIYLRLGLSILVGGIIGNVTDRFIHSAVIDFIAITVNNYTTPVMNAADIFQWVGYLFIFYGLYRDSLIYWPELNIRNNFFINPRFQIRMGFSLAFFSFITGFIILIFGLSFFQNDLAQENIKIYLIYGASLVVFLCIMLFILGLILSHRIAGPIFALKRFLNESYQGKSSALKLREHDEFKELETHLTILNIEMQRLYEIERKYNLK